MQAQGKGGNDKNQSKKKKAIKLGTLIL